MSCRPGWQRTSYWRPGLSNQFRFDEVKNMDSPLPVQGKLSSLDRTSMAIWAADCAEHVLPLFTETQPNDERPRLAIEAARAWARGDIKVGQARAAALASHAAARECTDAAACAAARAAGHAAATAHMAGHAVHAAEYAVKAVMSASASAAVAEESAWQCARLDAFRVRKEWPDT